MSAPPRIGDQRPLLPPSDNTCSTCKRPVNNLYFFLFTQCHHVLCSDCVTGAQPHKYQYQQSPNQFVACDIVWSGDLNRFLCNVCNRTQTLLTLPRFLYSTAEDAIRQCVLCHLDLQPLTLRQRVDHFKYECPMTEHPSDVVCNFCGGNQALGADPDTHLQKCQSVPLGGGRHGTFAQAQQEVQDNLNNEVVTNLINALETNPTVLQKVQEAVERVQQQQAELDKAKPGKRRRNK